MSHTINIQADATEQSNEQIQTLQIAIVGIMSAAYEQHMPESVVLKAFSILEKATSVSNVNISNCVFNHTAANPERDVKVKDGEGYAINYDEV